MLLMTESEFAQRNLKAFHELEGTGDDNDAPVDYTDGDTAGAEDTGTPAEAEDTTPENNPEDYTVPDDDQPQDDDPNQEGDNPEDETGEGEATDYTDDDGMEDEGGDPDGGEDDTGGYDDGGSSESENPQDAEIRDLEGQIFGDMSDKQTAIRDKELKENFSKMYDDIMEIVDRINNIPKSDSMIKPIEFVSDQLSILSDRVSDYLLYTYSTKPYTENVIMFNMFLSTLSKINEMISQIH